MAHHSVHFAVAFLASLTIAEVTLLPAYRHMASHIALALLSLVIADLVTTVLNRVLPYRTLQDLGGKAVLITGCDSGFGQECAKRLDALGVTVYAGCLLPDGEGAAALKASTSSRLRILPLDVTNEDSVQAAVHFVTSTIGDKVLWAVVNNAGVLSMGELHWTSMEQIERLFHVNLFGTVRVTTAFLDMVIGSKGRIVCVGSVAGWLTWGPLIVYSMSKHAVVAFCDGLRRQMRKWSVTVHCIEPFSYQTNMSSSDNIKSIMEKTWCSCSSNVRQHYGEECFNIYVKNHLKLGRKISHKNTAAVVDSMVDAAVGANPKVTYTCGIFAKWFLMLIPARVMDVILELFLPHRCQPAALQPNWEKMTKEEFAN